MKAEEAMRQASLTASIYMDSAVTALAEEIGIVNPTDRDRERILTDFGTVVGAMIQAAAQDFHTAAASGLIENYD